MMNRLPFFQYTTAGLLLLNISMITFFFMTRPEPRPRPMRGPHGFQSEAIEILNLDTKQEEIFNTLVSEHSQTLDSIKLAQESLLKPYFETLIDSTQNISKESVYKQIQLLEKRKIAVTHQHFLDVKEILNNDQIPVFQEFTRKAMGLMFFRREKNPPPPQDF